MFFLFVAFCSAFDFSVSPQELNFIGTKNTWICNNVTVKMSEILPISISSRWTNLEKSKEITDYKILNQESQIEIKTSNVDNTYTICLKSKYLVDKKGVLLFRIDKKPVGIGIWINFKTTEHNVLSSPYYKNGIITYILIVLGIVLIIEIIIFFKQNHKA